MQLLYCLSLSLSFKDQRIVDVYIHCIVHNIYVYGFGNNQGNCKTVKYQYQLDRSVITAATAVVFET